MWQHIFLFLVEPIQKTYKDSKGKILFNKAEEGVIVVLLRLTTTQLNGFLPAGLFGFCIGLTINIKVNCFY